MTDMNEERFWQLVEEAFAPGGHTFEGVSRLRDELEKLPRADVLAFHHTMHSVLKRANTWDLIGAAHFVGVDRKDDSFDEFRAWLITRGRETWEHVLRDADALAELPCERSPADEWRGFGMLAVARNAARGEDKATWPEFVDAPTPAGTRIDPITEDALRERFPALWQRFGNEFMSGVRGTKAHHENTWHFKDVWMSAVMCGVGGLLVYYGWLVRGNGYPFPLYAGSMIAGSLLALIGGNGVVRSLLAGARRLGGGDDDDGERDRAVP